KPRDRLVDGQPFAMLGRLAAARGIRGQPARTRRHAIPLAVIGDPGGQHVVRERPPSSRSHAFEDRRGSIFVNLYMELTEHILSEVTPHSERAREHHLHEDAAWPKW